MAKLAIVQAGGDAPSRAALREAIAHRDALKAQVAAIKPAQEEAQQRVLDASRAHERAQEGVTNARAAASIYLVDVAVGEAGEAPQTVAVARRLQTEAEDALEVARGARSALKTRLDSVEGDLRKATAHVERAALAVLREAPGIASMVEQVAQLQRALADKGDALQWLVSQGFISKEPIVTGPGPFDTAPAPVFIVEARLQSPPATWRRLQNDPSIPGAKVWTDALAALMQDADAPLPEAI